MTDLKNWPERLFLPPNQTAFTTPFDGGVEYVRADLAAPKVKPLDFPERRNGYWGHKDGYQVAHTDGDLFRVRLHGRVICRDIRGFDRAVKWSNEHHSRRILSMLEGE